MQLEQEPLTGSVEPSFSGQASASPVVVPWGAIAWFSALLLFSYFAIFKNLAIQWSVDEDVSHGFFVPLVAGYVAWQKKDEILGQPWTTNYLGLIITLYGSIQLIIGSLGAELFLQRTSFIIILAGAVLLTGGWKVLKACWLPIFILLFMVPLPKVVYGSLTLPLQLFASQVAEEVMLWLNIPVLRDGNIIELANGTKLSVVEACSGIRSLMSLTFIGVIYGHFFDGKPWMKWALLIGTIPIAVIANAARVTVTGIIADKDPSMVQGVLHTMEGWVIFVVDLALLILLHRVINFAWDKFGRKKVETGIAPSQA
jgi:exosortase